VPQAEAPLPGLLTRLKRKFWPRKLASR
jgi:hypothetical protein